MNTCSYLFNSSLLPKIVQVRAEHHARLNVLPSTVCLRTKILEESEINQSLAMFFRLLGLL